MLVHSFVYATTVLLSSFVTPASAAIPGACGTGTATGIGQVVDATGAVIVDATVTVAGGVVLHTGHDGRFVTGCLPDGTYTVEIASSGFEVVRRKLEIGSGGHALMVRLNPLTVTAEVDAAPEGQGGVDSTDIAGTRTLNKSDLAQLADDPDELSRQLQVLAATAGGAPGQATVTVNGFQNSGRIPPKSSISFIRINPDLFSAEYAQPPYRGGRVEIYTKPGQSSLHGALFTTQSAGWMNAQDPFSPSRAAIGKQRYGVELSGPMVKNRSDFALALEHRQISQFAVVDAVTLDGAGNQVAVVDNVAVPRSLWEGSARFGFQLNAKNNLTVTYTANVNELSNQGVGGNVLAEAGYNSVQSEQVVQVVNLQTVSATVVHETRLGYTWRYRADTPNSSAASLQVAGAFTGGGVNTGRLHAHERDLEFDDDILYSHGKHSVKAGIELLDTSMNDSQPVGFNGTYIFGGTSTISGIEQYRQALLGMPGGQYNVTTGTPNVSLNQLQTVLYVQDQWKFRPRLQLSGGIRWAMQNSPGTVGNIAPRLGLAWSPDRKQKTVFHLRSGMFYSVVDPQTTLAAVRLNGVVQRQLQMNNPVYGSPLTTGSSMVTTLRAPLPGLTQTPSLQSHLGVEHDFPRHSHAQANLYLVHAWNGLRSRNINAPLNGVAGGPRPGAADLDLYQYQQTGRLGGNVLFVGMDQHSLKKLQIFAGYVRMDLRGNADADSLFPQSSYSDQGETARPSWQATHQLIAFSNYVLPHAVNLSVQFNAASGQPYNVTTGFDNNGDGVFNDRPVFSAVSSSAVYSTAFGSLSSIGAGTPIGRNAGTLPWNIHFDTNLSHTFALPHKPNAEGRTLTANVRSTNILNHNNVLAVGGVLGSPLFGQAYQSDPGRRIEVGLRWNF